MKNWLIGIAVFLVLTAGTTFYFGFLDNAQTATVGKQRVNIERTNYEQSTSYVQGVIDDLSNKKLEYEKSTDPTAKQAILSYINDRYASFNVDQINDPSLQAFLLKSRGE